MQIGLRRLLKYSYTSKERVCWATAGGWPLLQVMQLATDTWMEIEASVTGRGRTETRKGCQTVYNSVSIGTG